MAVVTTLQAGTYNALTDAFTSVFDLNDQVTTWTQTFDPGMPEKVFVRAFNIRVAGEYVPRYQFKNRLVTATVFIKGASTTAILAAQHSLIAAIEDPIHHPYSLKIQLAGGANFSYADVVGCVYKLPYKALQYLQGYSIPIPVTFECKPFLRGARTSLANAVSNPGFEAPMGGGTAQVAPVVFTDNLTTGNAYVTLAGGAASLSAQQLTIPSGSVIGFGSPAWGAVQTWQVRFSWLTGQSAQFFLHWTDANNKLYVQADGTNLSAAQVVGGTAHALGSVAAALVNTTYYWLRITQFPAGPGSAPNVQAVILNDSAGTVGTVLATLASVSTFDAVTALMGRPAFGSNGANLLIGGISGTSNQVALFGPGGWNFVSATGANGPASFAWEQNTANTYPNGPVTSFGALRMDVAPAGSLSAQADLYTGGAPAGTQAIPIQTAGTVFGVAVWTKTSGFSGTGAIAAYLREFNSSGTFLRQTVIGSLSGNQAAWVKISGTATTGASAAFADLLFTIIDNTANSANGTAWFDNAQVWDQTRLGGQTTMPYCELTFPNSPAQLMVSGLLGDVPAPAIIAHGVYLNSFANGQTVPVYLGRRATTTPDAQLVGASNNQNPALDSSAFGGFAAPANPGQIFMTAAAALGTYRFLCRAKTGNASPTTVAVFTDIPIFLIAAGQSAAYAFAVDTTMAGEFDGANVYPFAAQNIWTAFDAGQMVLPPSAGSGLTDQTRIGVGASTFSTGTGSTAITANAVALIPVDGGLLITNLLNFGLPTITQKWFYAYADGTQLVIANSLETVSIPNFAAAVPNTIVGTVFAAVVASPVADAALTVDPTLKTPNATGVNQFGLWAADNNAVLLANETEIIYSPLYLWPL